MGDQLKIACGVFAAINFGDRPVFSYIYWGFAVITDKAESSNALDVLDAAGVQAEEIGHVNGSGGVRVHYRDKRIVLS